MKRFFSVILAVAMLLTLVTVNVAAAGEMKVKFTSPTPILADATKDQEVTVDFVIETNPGIVTLQGDFSFDTTALQLVKVENTGLLTGNYMGYGASAAATRYILSWDGDTLPANCTATGVAAKLTFKVLKTAGINDYAITFTPTSDSIYDFDQRLVTCEATGGVIKVTEKTNIKEDKAITADVAYGADLIAALPEKVTFNTVTTVSATEDTQEFDVNWNTTGLSTAPEIDGVKKLDTTNNTITVEGNPDITGNTFDANGKKAIATVTIKPIAATAADLTAATGKVKEDKDNGISKADITGSLPTEIAVEKNGIKDAFAVVWSDTITGYKDGKDYSENANITVNGTLTSPSKNGLFTSDTAITGTVTVGPANIEGGSFELTDSTFVPNTKPSVKVTIPASVVANMPVPTESDEAEVKAKYTVTISVPSKTEGAAPEIKSVELDKTVIQAAKDAVAAAAGDPEKLAKIEPITTTITLDKTLSDLGYDYSKDDKKAFTVSVTVGGTTLLTKDGKDSVDGTVVKPSAGGSSGSIGINKGNTTKTYAVTVVETKNGTATVSPEKAASGATVTVKPEPAEGYKVKSVTAVKADGTNVPVDEKAYTFTMPASAVKVTVEFEEGKNEPSVDPTPADDKFADVADDFWAAKDIYTLKDAGIIGGKSATEFDPEGDVTRAEFAKMVVGLFGYKATSDAVNFEDCKAEDWFTPYVAAGVEAGVIKGVSDTEFAPNATITREDACTILGRALNKVAQSNELKFTDADKVAEYAVPYVALLSELGYVNGYEDGSFLPQNNITRAEAAKIIAGIYNAKDSTEDKADNTDTIDVAPEK